MLHKTIYIFFLYTLLLACTNQRMDWDPDDYTVAAGDTLYSIAWRYEMDPDDLAKWNHLSPPHIIHPGDRLHTNQTDSFEADKFRAAAEEEQQQQQQQSNRPTEITVIRGDTLYSLSKGTDVSVDRLAAINGLNKPYVINPGQTLYLTDQTEVEPVITPLIAPVVQNTIRQLATPPVTQKIINAPVIAVDTNRTVNWQWPVDGKVIVGFNKSKNNAKGIDIAGIEGRPVSAASSGKVVYSGNGLISYGNLVIIKHSRSYLSAYAHNKKLLVKEGETVKAGQKIAELGKTGVEKPKLHFEIRKNGKPVDPLRYLPRS